MPVEPSAATLTLMVAGAAAEEALLQEVRRLVPASQAAALVRLAAGILRVDKPSPSQADKILRLCRALAGEGGLVRHMAVEIARELAGYEKRPGRAISRRLAGPMSPVLE